MRFHAGNCDQNLSMYISVLVKGNALSICWTNMLITVLCNDDVNCHDYLASENTANIAQTNEAHD